MVCVFFGLCVCSLACSMNIRKCGLCTGTKFTFPCIYFEERVYIVSDVLKLSVRSKELSNHDCIVMILPSWASWPSCCTNVRG